MASSETERADEEAAGSTKAAATDEVDGGWGSVAPKAAGATVENVSAEPKPAAGDAKTVDAPPPAETPEAPAEPPPVEAAPVESPPVESPPAKPAPRPPPPPLPRPHLAAEATSQPVEAAGAPDAPAPPPLGATRASSPLPARVEATKALPLVPALPEVEDPRPPLFGEPPTKGWFFVGGGGMLLALFVGILIGRLSSPPPRVPVPPTPAPRAAPPVVPPPAPSPVASASAPAAPSKSNAPVTKHAAPPFNAQAAKAAIDRVVPKLKGCKQPGEPPGTATVTVTFAPTGRVSNAAVTTTRYAGTRTGSCIAQRLHEARIPEFTGPLTTVKRGVAVR